MGVKKWKPIEKKNEKEKNENAKKIVQRIAHVWKYIGETA